jgi:hypothetical protein
MDTGANVPSDANGGGSDAGLDAAAMADVPTYSDGGQASVDAGSGMDAARCSVGTASATVNGTSVAFAGCTGF